MRRQTPGSKDGAAARGDCPARRNQPRKKQSGKGAGAKNSNKKRQDGARKIESGYQGINKQNPFGNYWSLEDVSEGLKDGSLIQSSVRIHPKRNIKAAYLTDPNGGTDIMIDGIKTRNRALPGDVVTVKLMPKSKWKFLEEEFKAYSQAKDSATAESGAKVVEGLSSAADEIPDRFYKRVGEVVHIVEKKHSRMCVGYLKMPKEQTMANCRFYQLDQRLPILNVPVKECPDDFKERPEDFAQTLFIARISDWSRSFGVAMGQFVRRLCEKGDIDDKAKRIMKDYDINYSEFIDQKFEKYWTLPDVEKGLENGTLLRSVVRIKNRNVAYAEDPNGGLSIIIDGFWTRNRALHGDDAALKLLPKSEWKLLEEDYKEYRLQRSSDQNTADDDLPDMTKSTADKIPEKFYQKLGKVVHILEMKHNRMCVGNLKTPPEENKNKNIVRFAPRDQRLPMLNVAIEECPDGFKERPKDFEKTLFVVKIQDWPKDSGIGEGHFFKSLGEAGDIEAETERILIENNIDYSEFSDEVLECLPKELPWAIPEEEFGKRKDLRKECIFTIDPESSGDLDDALHCKALDDGTYEVGVHIADVSYFIKEDTALDQEAAKRANTVYLVRPRQEDIPMLPDLLWKDLCSLNPDNDKLAFSIIWKMDEDGKILDEWCGRTVIHSCIRMAYAHAQQVIETPEKEFTEEELPTITNGFGIPQVVASVLNLNKIALKLREKRFDDGALWLSRIQLQYILDKDTKLPMSVEEKQLKESNTLVEEFMLLANTSVARRIYDTYKDRAFSRRQPPPKDKVLQDMIDMCQKMGIDIEGNTSGDLEKSLKKYKGNDEFSKGRAQVLAMLFGKTLNREMYFCPGTMEDEDSYRHYCLNLPLYTQFTSPIRRYADIIVHRLLAASLGYTEEPPRKKEELEAQASHCNTMESKAKYAAKQIRDIFFVTYVKLRGPLEENAMVMNVSQKCIEVLLLRLGLTQNIYLDALPLSGTDFDDTKHEKMLTLCWEADDNHPATSQQIKIFTQVSCVLEKADTAPLALKTTIKRPDM